MARKARKDARQVTGGETPVEGRRPDKSRQVTEISAERAAARVERAWVALGEQWLIPYAPNRASALVDETISTRTDLSSARHALFELIGDRLGEAVRAGQSKLVITWAEANTYAERRSGKSLSEGNFSKSISLWRKGEAGSENATPVRMSNGWLQITGGGRECAEIQIIPPRNMSHAMTTMVNVRLSDKDGTIYQVIKPEQAPAPVADQVDPDDAAARARASEDASSADRLNAEARTLERRGHRQIATGLRKLARSLQRAAREHRVLAGLLVFFLVTGGLYAASPAVRHGVHRTIKTVRHWFAKRVLFLLSDFTRLTQVPGTIAVRQEDDTVHLTARPLTARLKGKAVRTVWMRFGVITPMLIHRPSEDNHVGPSWDIPIDDIDPEGTVIMAMLADAGDVRDPARIVPDEDVQSDYIGLRLRGGRVEVFNVDTLVPPPHLPKDQHQLRGVNLNIETSR